MKFPQKIAALTLSVLILALCSLTALAASSSFPPSTGTLAALNMNNVSQIGVSDGGTTVDNIADSHGFTLPRTGGNGTVLFTAGGVILIGVAVIILMTSTFKKKRTTKTRTGHRRFFNPVRHPQTAQIPLPVGLVAPSEVEKDRS